MAIVVRVFIFVVRGFVGVKMMQRNVRDGEYFGEVRKESLFYSNELYSHLKIQDVA